ncbi:MAG: carboxypeptidase-like regulatory domain-containing protein [Elusimicrobia bacterium]|nr:carboxypeptidase-like regulatory domain-containing protein [Elusimicrobiota bacterium]
MTTVPCPRCGMLVGLEEEICPHCRAPRDDMEMEEGRAFVRKEELRLKRRPKIIAARVVAAVLLASVWFLRGFVTAPLGSAWREFQAEVEKTRQPSHWIKDKAVEPPTASNTRPEVAVSSFIYLNAPPPAPQGPAEPPPDPAAAAAPAAVVATPLSVIADPAYAPPPPSPGELRIHGQVYDLETKLPVNNAKVQFRQPRSDAKWEATTDAAGRYQVGLYKDPSDGILVMIEAPGYRKGLLEDRDPPYRERSPQSRADLIAETVDSDLEAVPLRYKESAQIVELDLVLVPQAKK